MRILQLQRFEVSTSGALRRRPVGDEIGEMRAPRVDEPNERVTPCPRQAPTRWFTSRPERDHASALELTLHSLHLFGGDLMMLGERFQLHGWISRDLNQEPRRARAQRDSRTGDDLRDVLAPNVAIGEQGEPPTKLGFRFGGYRTRKRPRDLLTWLGGDGRDRAA